jgi:hypothetical protein
MMENENLAKTLLDERDMFNKEKGDLLREFSKKENDLKCKIISKISKLTGIS